MAEITRNELVLAALRGLFTCPRKCASLSSVWDGIFLHFIHYIFRCDTHEVTQYVCNPSFALRCANVSLCFGVISPPFGLACACQPSGYFKIKSWMKVAGWKTSTSGSEGLLDKKKWCSNLTILLWRLFFCQFTWEFTPVLPCWGRKKINIYQYGSLKSR